MKVCRFLQDRNIKFGIIKDDFIFPFNDLKDLKQSSGKLDSIAYLKKSEITLLAPTVPSKIVCVGRNYAEHASEMGNEIPKEPLLFLKAPSSLITDGDEIVLPRHSKQVEHEGELALVIGRDCKNIADDADPFEYILGYACLNDVTARDLQRADVQFSRAKSFDTFCPISAVIETELDVSDVRVNAKVNGVIKQDGRTSQMVFSVSTLLKYISDQMTLNTGDIIATGTPSGVSVLNDGDICEVEIEGIGVLRNTVRG